MTNIIQMLPIQKKRLIFSLLAKYDRAAAFKGMIKDCSHIRQTETFFCRYPNLRNVASEISYRLTHALCDQAGKPLVAKHVEIAIERARIVFNTGQDPYAQERQFLLTLSDIGRDLYGLSVSGISRSSEKRFTWPKMDSPLPDWMRLNDIQDLQVEYGVNDVSSISPNMLFAYKVYPPVYLNLINDMLNLMQNKNQILQPSKFE